MPDAARVLRASSIRRGGEALRPIHNAQEGAEPDDKKALKQVQRDKDISKNISNLSPSEQSWDGGEFAKLWKEWPEASRPRNRLYADKLFARLTPEDRGRPLALASCYRIAQTRRGGFAAMILYLRDRLFLEFHDAPLIDSDGYFVIRPDREEWAAWLEHYRSRCSETILISTQKRGYLLTRTRWPDENILAFGSKLNNSMAKPPSRPCGATRLSPMTSQS